jgi:hypothetical protein
MMMIITVITTHRRRYSGRDPEGADSLVALTDRE